MALLPSTGNVEAEGVLKEFYRFCFLSHPVSCDRDGKDIPSLVWVSSRKVEEFGMVGFYCTELWLWLAGSIIMGNCSEKSIIRKKVVRWK